MQQTKLIRWLKYCLLLSDSASMSRYLFIEITHSSTLEWKVKIELSEDFFKSQEPRLWHVQDVSEFTESFCCRCHGEQMLSRLSNNPPNELFLDEVQTGEERRVQLSVLYSAWDSGDAARQRGLWAAEWGKHTSPLAAHTPSHRGKQAFILPVSVHRCIIVSACVCVQLKYKAALKKGRSSSLFHLLPETLETARAREVSELLSEVTTECRSASFFFFIVISAAWWSCRPTICFFRWSTKRTVRRRWAWACTLCCLRPSTHSTPRRHQTCTARYSDISFFVWTHLSFWKHGKDVWLFSSSSDVGLNSETEIFPSWSSPQLHFTLPKHKIVLVGQRITTKHFCSVVVICDFCLCKSCCGWLCLPAYSFWILYMYIICKVLVFFIYIHVMYFLGFFCRYHDDDGGN